MAIEVLRKGRLPAPRVVLGICYHCNAELRREDTDGNHYGDQQGGDWNLVVCPECEHIVIGSYQ